MKRPVAIAAAALLFLPGAFAEEAAPPPAAAKSPEALDEEVRANEEELRKLSEKATSVLDELDHAEEEMRGLKDAAAVAERDLKAADRKLQAALAQEETARKALLARLDELSPRLRARYRMSKYGKMGFLLSARSVGELLRRRRMIDLVLQSDLAMLKDARALFDKLDARRAELQKARDEHAKVKAVAEERRAKAKKRQEELASLHDAVMEQKSLRQKTLSELYARQAELGRYVAGLKPDEAAREEKTPMSKRKGHLPFPTEGFIEVGFGKVLNARFNTVTFQNGIDIRAPEGAEVKAVAPGKVVHAGPFKGYGNLVIVDHGGGYHSLYAHLAAITRAVGDEVEDTGVLGTVGDTGSLKGPYLYFEIREQGKPVNPKGWFGK